MGRELGLTTEALSTGLEGFGSTSGNSSGLSASSCLSSSASILTARLRRVESTPSLLAILSKISRRSVSSAARLAASGLVVPVFVELAMRGLVLRLVLQWQEARAAGAEKPFEEALARRSVKDVAPGAWSPLAVAVSTLAFMAMHDPATEWPAAAAYGALMAGLWIVRRDLLSCIVAHGVTNVVLACYVRATGAWALW